MAEVLSFCMVSTFYPPHSFGGDAVHVEQLATGLARRGHRVRVLHNPTAHRLLGGQPAAPSPAQSRSGGAAGGVEVLPVLTGPSGAAASAATYLVGGPTGYRKRLERLTAGFDVVHFHNPSLLGGPGGLASGSPGSVRLLTTHEHWLLCPMHTLFRYNREVCTSRTCWRCCLAYRRPPQPWRSVRPLGEQLAVLDALLAPSRFTAALHRRAFPDMRVELLPLLPPDPASLAAAAAPPEAEGSTRPFFLFAGRLERIKGADWLVDAFETVRGADLVIVGEGSQAGEIRRRAEANPAVRLLGRLAHPQVLALMRAARAVVVPSAGYETFGLSAVEAMALGTPVVVRAIGPLPELVEHGGGLAVADEPEMVAALQGLVDDEGLASRMGEEAAAVSATRGQEPAFRRYFELVSELAANRGQHRAARAAAVAASEASEPGE
ncbi:MAG: glycosyltransferase [Acidimicrobiales bacterium]